MDHSRTTGAFPPRELLNADGELILLMNSGEDMLELEVDDVKLDESMSTAKLQGPIKPVRSSIPEVFKRLSNHTR
jgi:hypothetical protein